MIKNRYIAFALFVALFVLIGNLIDYLYAVFVTGGAYHFSAAGGLIAPLAVGVAVGYFAFLRNGKD